MSDGRASTSTSPARAPSTPAFDLQAHLFASLLQGHTADVSLVVHGSWEAVYRLHRVVLIQAGFFRSLFHSSGFAETRRVFRDRDEIEITFDDPNITRPAFELCISRLYGGGPPLHVDPGLIPTLSQPLTPKYPNTNTANQIPIPDGHHPASPRLLLSLIATSLYLSIPVVASQALSSVLSTLGPSTVGQYLDFACGKGIGPVGPDEPEAAIGLEALAQPLLDNASRYDTSTGFTTPALSISMSGAPDNNAFEHAFEKLDMLKEDPNRASIINGGVRTERQFDYGNVSNKVGEAAACWLARWGVDLFAEEQKVFGGGNDATPGTIVPKTWSQGGLSTKWVCAILGSDALFVKGEQERYALAKGVYELRKSQGPFTSVDEDLWTELFHHGIYYSNMVMEDLMTITTEVSPSSGKPYVDLPNIQGAHWDQSILKQLISARPQVSSTSPTTSGSPPPREKELGLAITLATPDLDKGKGKDKNNDQSDLTSMGLGGSYSKQLYRIPEDASSRIGDSVVEASSMDELFNMNSSSTNRRASRTQTSEANFFGLAPDRITISTGINSGDLLSQSQVGTSQSRWSRHAPLRFGVEFWDVASLTEKARLHSQTVWYAGSLYNVYVQVVRKKASGTGVGSGGAQVQLGVYLHRQSTVEVIPSASVPKYRVPPVVTMAPMPMTSRSHARGPSLPTPVFHTSLSTPSITRPTTPGRSTIVGSLPGGSSFEVSNHRAHDAQKVSNIPSVAPTSTPPQPYRDSRPAVSAYFTIACHSATGASLTRFSSAPDVFAIGQSWGWKSSSRTDEYFDVGSSGSGSGLDDMSARTEEDVRRQRMMSLRATVILGVV